MLGLQLWLNLPAADKMTEPRYFDITRDMMGEKQTDAGTVRVIAGEYQGAKGAQPYHIQASVYDVLLQPGKSLSLPVKPEDNAFAFLIEGDAVIDGQPIAEKTAVLFEREGDTVTVAAPQNSPARFIYCSGKPLGEPISWGGPIVMNTKEELQRAFNELRDGTFIKHRPAGI